MSFKSIFDKLMETPEEEVARLASAPGTAYLATLPVLINDPELRGVVIHLRGHHPDYPTGVIAAVIGHSYSSASTKAKRLPDGRHYRNDGYYDLVVLDYDRPENASKHNAGYPVGGYNICATEAEIRRSERCDMTQFRKN